MLKPGTRVRYYWGNKRRIGRFLRHICGYYYFQGGPGPFSIHTRNKIELLDGEFEVIDEQGVSNRP